MIKAAQESKPEIVRYGGLHMAVCVPEGWDDERVVRFAESGYPCGTSGGWFIRKEGSRFLAGDPERFPCDTKRGFVHIVLDA